MTKNNKRKSVAKKISITMKRKRIDNFKNWRNEMKSKGLIKSEYPSFAKNEALAELVGVILGDGHIQKFPRTERLLIFGNSKNIGFINRYTEFTTAVFNKRPSVTKTKGKNCTRISIYEKNISKRLNIPTGSRKMKKISMPKWISKEKTLQVAFLKGLYEAEGSFCVHKPTGTYKMFFSNKNTSLLKLVEKMLLKLDLHPNKSGHKIQISRKNEVYRLKELINFREYDSINA